MKSRWVYLSVLAMVAGLSACDDEPPVPDYKCDSGSPQRWNSCFDPSQKAMSCLLQQLREREAAGQFDVSTLPDWAITRERNGAPIIYDVRARDLPFFTPDAMGWLEAWAARKEVKIDKTRLSRCEASITEGQVRRAEGGGRETTTWKVDMDDLCGRWDPDSSDCVTWEPSSS